MNPTPNVDVAQNPVVDTSNFPLVLVRFAPTKPTDAQIEAFIAQITTILEKRTKHVFVHDALDVAMGIDARQRARFTELVNDPRMRDLSRYKIAEVILLRSAILRGAMTAVFWIAPPASPTKAFATVEEAVPFVAERFREEGLAFTPAIETALRRWGRR